MKNNSRFSQSYLVLGLIFAAATSACSTAGGKQSTVLGNSSTGRDLKGSVTEVTSRSQSALKELGIQITDSSSKDSGKEMDLSGKSSNHNVSVQINDLGNGMSHVEVSAKDGTLQWNKDYAKSVLEKIIEKS
jgi:hypothetical protein